MVNGEFSVNVVKYGQIENKYGLWPVSWLNSYHNMASIVMYSLLFSNRLILNL